MIAFEIPYPKTKAGKAAWNRRYGLNAYYAGKHWSQRKKDAEELHALFLLSMKKAGIRRELVTYPVEVRFYWDDNLDVDNHAAMGKAFVDAMKGYLLPDDNRRWFCQVTHKFWNRDCIRVEVRKYDPLVAQCPMGAYTFLIACSHCKRRGSKHENEICKLCKSDVSPGFEFDPNSFPKYQTTGASRVEVTIQEVQE